MGPLSEIAGYDLLETLGGGAQTLVCAARSRETGLPCVVKMVRRPWESHPGALKRLRREARVLLGVRHHGIVHVQHAYVVRPPFHLVLDRAPGVSLRQILTRDGTLETQRAMRITRQVAEAMVALLHAGFVHGDIRPENILIDEDHAVLIDFGLARRLADCSPIEPGTPLGATSYLAPELCEPEPMDHPRSDLFSLGSTFYEMLTGRVPFPAASIEEGRRPERLERRLAGIAPALVPILARLLDRDPKQRPHPQRLVNELTMLHANATLRNAS